ncbi:MAG: monofunctional biosynthetic peptidoglycan transglycosylase [Desulforhopalus sp.]|jgi:monofunctional biosynthetic peptidoglycan transglycosylase
MVLRSAEQLLDGQTVTLKHQWLPIESISNNLSLAVICSEDQNFLNHYGIDVKAIQRSLKDSRNGSARFRGASTISQQTAKNVFLWPERSWLRKGLEVYFTLLIELFWPKERILEVYLNSIEMGRGVYGAEAAAHYYFNKSAKKLTRREAAAIAAALPNPREYPVNPPSPYIQGRINWIMKQMRLFGPLDLN